MERSNNYVVDNFVNSSKWAPIAGSWSVVNNEYHTNGAGETITKANDFNAKDIVFECDLKLAPTGDAGITIRSSNGVDGYFISFRPADNAIYVYELINSPPLVQQNNSVGIAANIWKHVRVIMKDNKMLVYYDDMAGPKINFTTNAYLSAGGLFLRSYNNAAAYRNVKAYEISDFFADTVDGQLLTQWIPYKGDSVGVENERIRLHTGSGGLYGNVSGALVANTGDIADFVLEADIRVDTGNLCVCGLMFRNTNAVAETGYSLEFAANGCYVKKYSNAGDTTVASKTGIGLTLNVFHHVKVICYGSDILVYFNDMLKPIIVVNDNAHSTGKFGIKAWGGLCFYDNICIRNFDPKHVVKVRVLNYNPILTTKGNQRLIDYYGFIDPKDLSYQYITSLLMATDYQVYHRIVQWTEINGFPIVKTPNDYEVTDYDEGSYLADFPKNSSYKKFNLEGVDKPRFDYSRILSNYGIVAQVQNNQVDEVWTWADGGIDMFYEAFMVGDGAFWINGLQIPMAGVRKFAVMGFDYTRTFDLALHSLGHRIEHTMSHCYARNILIFGTPTPLDYNNLNNIEKFMLSKYRIGVEVVNNSHAIAGCGDIHYPPNNIIDKTNGIDERYKYDAVRSINSNFAYWKNYGKSGYIISETDDINADTWGDSHEGFMGLWMACVPKATGSDEFGVYKDWWKYILFKVPL